MTTTMAATDPSDSPLRSLPLQSRHLRRRVALLCDPRFPGGTSASVAQEIRALAPEFDLSVIALETAMFRGRRLNPVIEAAAEEHGITVAWMPPVVHADTIVLHNPSCLRFDTSPLLRLSCAQALVVTHENLLRPNGSESHDVGGCLDLVAAMLTCGHRALAPVSPANRETVEAWLERRCARGWQVTPDDWPPILDAALVPPTAAPRDRRGRHSRPGLEKFPSLAAMRAHFPPHAERCAILGGDGFLADPETVPPNWEIARFGSVDVASFLAGIDFFVYFTNPNWRESFGRVIAEAIAAGKLVITDPGTAASFPGAVVASDGSDVDAIIKGFIADPRRYVSFVEVAQASLAGYGPAAFVKRARTLVEAAAGDLADALV